MGKFLTIRQAAERARVTDRTVRRWRVEGRLTAYATETGRVLVDEGELLDLITPKVVAVSAASRVATGAVS